MESIQNRQLEIQRAYMNHVTNCDTSYMKDQCLSLVMECTEAMNELPWKSWKKNQSFNKDKFIGELVDAQLFMLNLLNECGVSYDEFVQKCDAKQQINIERYKSNY